MRARAKSQHEGKSTRGATRLLLGAVARATGVLTVARAREIGALLGRELFLLGLCAVVVVVIIVVDLDRRLLRRGAARGG